MANLRIIKKDIDFLISEVISDCWVFLHVNERENRDLVTGIINEAVDLRNNLFHKVNNPDKDHIKTHYKNINQSLLSGVDDLFMKISSLKHK